MRSMTSRTGAGIAGLVGGLALMTMADVASAQTARAPAVTLTEAQAARAAAAQPGSSRLRFTVRGRWGLDLNLNQPVGRENNLSDVEAGAY